MSPLNLVYTLLFLSLCQSQVIWSAELTFELPDKRKDCFYETFESGNKAQLDFRVLAGGKYDIDVRLFGPDQSVIYQGNRLQHGGHVFSVTQPGAHRVCFSNKFSTFAHKLVFFVLRSGREEAVPAEPMKPADSSQHQLASSLGAVAGHLAAVRDYQTRVRLDETTDRLAAEATAGTVSLWAAAESLAIVAVGACQVLALRRLFPARRAPVVRLQGAT